MSESALSNNLYEQRFVLHDQRSDTGSALESLQKAVAAHGYSRAGTFAVRLALEEALANAFKHGNKNDPGKSVTLNCRVDDSHVELIVEDQGEGFDYEAIPDPTQSENIEIPAGRGIMLMRAYMKEVEFNDTGNRVRMLYEKQQQSNV